MRRLGALTVACTLGANRAAPPPRPTRLRVTWQSRAYEPARITVLAGRTVRRSGDSLNHNASRRERRLRLGLRCPRRKLLVQVHQNRGTTPNNRLIHKFMKGSVDVFSLVLTWTRATCPRRKAGRRRRGSRTRRNSFRHAHKVGGGEPARTVKRGPTGASPSVPRQNARRRPRQPSAKQQAPSLSRSFHDSPSRTRRMLSA